MRLRSFVAPFLVLVAVASFGMWLQGAVPDVPTGTWLPGPVLAQPRAGAVSATLADGSVLVIGGRTAEGPVRTVDVYGADGVVRSGRPLTVPRAGHTAATLPDGSVLVIGGTTTATGEDGTLREAPTPSAELYVGGVWTTVGPLSFARTGHTATALPDGRVLVAGGTGESGALDSLEVYDPEHGTFSFLTVLPSPVTEHAATLAGENQVLVAGGRNGAAVLASASLVNVDTAGVVPVTLGTARAAASATTLLNGHRILIAGGYTIEPNAEGASVERDLASTEIVNVAVMPATVSAGASMAQPRRNPQALLLPNNATVLITGGTTNGAVVPGAEQYVPWARAFTPTGSPAVPRAGGTLAGVKKEGAALLAGGVAESELYGFATIETDKDDYSPGMVVYVSGSGWQPGETVTFKLREVAASDDTSPTSCTLRTFSIVADDAGRIANAKLFDVEEHHLGVRFYLTAIGAASQAQVTFTDGGFLAKTAAVGSTAAVPLVVYPTSVSGSCPSSVPPGSTTSTLNVNSVGTTVGLSNNQLAKLTIPLSSNEGTPFVSVAIVGNGGEIISNAVNAAATAREVCIRSTNNSLTNVATLTITYGSAATTTLSLASSQNPSAYSQAVSFTATVTAGTGTPTGTVQFRIDGTPFGSPVNLVSGQATSGSTSSLTVAGSPHTITADYSPTGSFASSTGTLSQTVTKATPAITWEDPSPITYGTALGNAQLNATAGVAGSFSYTPASGTVLDAGVHTLAVVFTPTDTANYNPAGKNVSISVLKATPVLTWTDPADIVYGTLLSATQLNATADVPGTFVYTPAAGTKLNAGNAQTLSVTFTPTDAANYNNAAKTVSIDVLKATPVITWADPADIVYGTLLSATQLNASADVDGAFAYAPAAGTKLNAGNAQTLSVTFTPTDAANYNNATKTVSVNVLKATPVITWADPADIVYGTLLSATQLNASADVDGAFVYSPAAGTKLNAGAGQTLTANFTPTDAANYNDTSKTVTIDVLKATPVITWATPADIVYGTLLSDTQLNATADVPGAFAYAPAAGTKLNAGAGQTLAVNFTPGDPANYNDASKTVALNVVRKPASVTPAPNGKTYGDQDPVLTGWLQGFLPADDVTAIYSRNPGENAGPYTITAVLSPGAVLGNYDITQNTAPFIISKRLLTVTARSFTILYGAPTPAFDVTYGQFVGGDTAATATTGTPEFKFTGIAPTSYPSSTVPPTEPGAYSIAVSGLSSANYELSFVTGRFDIQFAWTGYLQPINDTAHQIGQTLSKFKLGQTIPAKFVLRDANGNIVQQAGSPTFARSGSLGPCDTSLLTETVELVAADSVPVYRWDGAQYHFNWSTKGMMAGLYRIFANLADGTQRSVDICLTR